MVNKYIDQGVAELVPGVLFVDEVKVQMSTVPLELPPDLSCNHFPGEHHGLCESC